MLPNRNAIASPQATVLSERKWPPRRSVTKPRIAAMLQVRTTASTSPSQGE